MNDRTVVAGRPFDAVLVVSFGGPQGMDDIRPFLDNVLRGRRVSPERLAEVAHHYELFGGVSPITALTMAQARGLAARLAAYGPSLPVYVGMRNWRPFLAETLAEMSRAGVRRAVGFITAGHKSYSSCGQYKVNVADARKELAAQGLADVEVSFVGDWFAHEGLVLANAQRVAEALSRLPAEKREHARVVFTAHSIPMSMARESRYVANLEATAGLVMERLGRTGHAVVFQSRSGRPEDPWLEPDVNDYLRAERAKGLEAAVVSPIGFVCDHVEVLYDLDHELRETCDAIGLTMTRASAVNDADAFVDLMADVVRGHYAAHATHRRLPIVGTPPRVEGPPPRRPGG
jgi:ferrochelatase